MRKTAIAICLVIAGWSLFVLCSSCVDRTRQEEFDRRFTEGHRAGVVGVPPTACPYPSWTMAHDDWKRGYVAGAQAKQEAK